MTEYLVGLCQIIPISRYQLASWSLEEAVNFSFELVSLKRDSRDSLFLGLSANLYALFNFLGDDLQNIDLA